MGDAIGSKAGATTSRPRCPTTVPSGLPSRARAKGDRIISPARRALDPAMRLTIRPSIPLALLPGPQSRDSRGDMPPAHLDQRRRVAQRGRTPTACPRLSRSRIGLYELRHAGIPVLLLPSRLPAAPRRARTELRQLREHHRDRLREPSPPAPTRPRRLTSTAAHVTDRKLDAHQTATFAIGEALAPPISPRRGPGRADDGQARGVVRSVRPIARANRQPAKVNAASSTKGKQRQAQVLIRAGCFPRRGPTAPPAPRPGGEQQR